MKDYNPEYDDEAGMADNNLETLRRAVEGIDQVISAGDNLPEWCQEKIAVAKSMLVTVWDYMRSEEERGAIAEGKKSRRDPIRTIKTKGPNKIDMEKTKKQAAKKKKKKSNYSESLEIELHSKLKENREMKNWRETPGRIMPAESRKPKVSEPQARREGDEWVVMLAGKMYRISTDEASSREEAISIAKSNAGISEARYKFSGKTGGMERDDSDADQRHGLYINGKLARTYNTKDEAENVKRRDPKFKDATIKKIAEQVEDPFNPRRYRPNSITAVMKRQAKIPNSKIVLSQGGLYLLAPENDPRPAVKLNDELVKQRQEARQKINDMHDEIRAFYQAQTGSDFDFSGIYKLNQRLYKLQKELRDLKNEPDHVFVQNSKESIGEGWTHDSLAAQLFEQDLTYEDELNRMLKGKLKK